MIDRPRSRRNYRSPRRQAQAEATRHEVLAAAARLFVDRGYVGTTMQAIAREAGVAVETVYGAFGSKKAMLKRLVDIAVVGDEAPIPLLDRSSPQQVRRETDQSRQIRLFAHDIRTILDRVAGYFTVMRVAAQTEPEVADLLAELLKARRGGMNFFVDALAHNGPLRAGLAVTEAADTVWAITSPEVYRLLVIDSSWTADHYESWLADSLTTLLIA